MLAFSWDVAITRFLGLPTSGLFDGFPWTAVLALAIVGALVGEWVLWVTRSITDRKE